MSIKNIIFIRLMCYSRSWYTFSMKEKFIRNTNTKCCVCDTLIYRRPSLLKESDGRAFCSVSCYGIHCRNERPCIVCGKPILAHFHKKTCSRSCANTNRAGTKYIGSPLKDKVRNQQSLKLRLLKDRGKKCERCGYRKFEILQIHHKNRSRIDNDMSNLELICPNCHYEEHLLEKSWLKNFKI